MTTAVVSLKFSPGHIAHLRAYNALFDEICDNVLLYLAPEYEKYMSDLPNVLFTEDINSIVEEKPDIVFIYNISTYNTHLAQLCKTKGIRTLYVLHEPWGSISDLIKEKSAIPKTIGAYIVNGHICRNVDKVLLASETGMKNYEDRMLWCNKSHARFPLIFLDQYDSAKCIKRQFFSFIGAFVEVHGSFEFLNFMEYALEITDDIRFLIATKNDVTRYLNKDSFQKAIVDKRLVIQQGRPMTTEEINGYYRQSICVWNAYNRSTQSGVLPNALMQGAPVIVNENGAAKEIMKDRTVGCFIKMPPENKQILDCYRYIEAHLEEMDRNARKIFLSNYCYSNYLNLAKEVILS